MKREKKGPFQNRGANESAAAAFPLIHIKKNTAVHLISIHEMC